MFGFELSVGKVFVVNVVLFFVCLIYIYMDFEFDNVFELDFWGSVEKGDVMLYVFEN